MMCKEDSNQLKFAAKTLHSSYSFSIRTSDQILEALHIDFASSISIDGESKAKLSKPFVRIFGIKVRRSIKFKLEGNKGRTLVLSISYFDFRRYYSEPLSFYHASISIGVVCILSNYGVGDG